MPLTRLTEQLLPCDKTGLETLCTSLWAAYDARLLPSPTNFAPSAFYNLVGTILDCIVLLNIRSTKGEAVHAQAQTVADSNMGDAVSAQVGRVWRDGVIPEASKIVRMTRMIGAEKNTDFYKMATNVGSTVARLEKVSSSRSYRRLLTHHFGTHVKLPSLLSATAEMALEEIARVTKAAFFPVDDPETSLSAASTLIPRLQLLLEALEQGYSSDEPRIKSFTDRLALEVSLRAVQYIKQYLSSNGSSDKLALEDYPKMLANLLDKRGSRLIRDEVFDKVSAAWHVRRADCTTYRIAADRVSTSYLSNKLMLCSFGLKQTYSHQYTVVSYNCCLLKWLRARGSSSPSRLLGHQDRQSSRIRQLFLLHSGNQKPESTQTAQSGATLPSKRERKLCHRTKFPLKRSN